MLLLCLCVTRDAERLQAQATLTDRQILEALYDATDGANWTNNKDWKSAGSVCTWHGVECENGAVIDLDLSDNNLSGTIPSSLGGLSSLVTLDLSRNQLMGAIPPELANLSSLVSLALFRNQLTGEIPSELGRLNNLASLIIADNQLTGKIPPELANLSSLQSLALYRNQLTGSIPSSLGGLTSLSRLDLWDNDLTGSIPSSLGSLSRLGLLRLHNNQLTGPIPPDLGNLTNLTRLDLWGNDLTGSIPANFANLTNLESLELGENNLSGTIPSWLGDLTNLTYLSLHSNQLSGSIPPELGNLSNLTTLYLSNNRLTGSIPPELGNLTNLTAMQLHFNQLSGSIPSRLGETALEHLQLSNNRLSGPIPPELGRLTALTQLYLNHNDLSGPIPPELGDLKNLTDLRLHFNELTGSIPSELGKLSSLETLWLRSNQLTGPIPSSLGNLTNLTYLNAGHNQLTGPIPPELGKLSSLETLWLHNNQLRGPIPSDLGQLTALTVLGLSSNSLEGDVPDLNQLPLLRLDLGANRLNLSWDTFSSTGPINLETKSNSLEGLWLYGSGLIGNIPDWIGNHTDLEYLRLQNNDLTGRIPDSFANLTKLRYLSLYRNDRLTQNLDMLTGLTSVTVSATEASAPQGLSAWLGGSPSNVRLTLPEGADARRSIITLTPIQHSDLVDVDTMPLKQYGDLASEDLGLEVRVGVFNDQDRQLAIALGGLPTFVCFGVPESDAEQAVVFENEWEYDDDEWNKLESADPPSSFSPGAENKAVCGEIGLFNSTLFIPVVDKSAAVGVPSGSVEALISRIEPSVRSVTVSAGDVVRLSFDIYGVQDILDNDLGEDEVFIWDDGGANGSFKSDKRANVIIYTAPTTYGKHTVTVTPRGGACEAGDDAEERCSATFTITVRRPSSVPEARPAPKNPEGKFPSVLVDAEGRQYEVFTPEEGGIFDGGEVRLSADPGVVPNGEVVGLRAEVAGPASNEGMTHHRYTLVGDAYELMAVDAAGTAISSSYVLNEPLEVCVPLPPVARRDISDVAMVVHNIDGTLTTLSASPRIVPSGVEFCGNLSMVPATVSVGVDGSPAALPTAVPEEEPVPPDTGGSSPSGTGLLIFVILGAGLTIVGASLAKGFRKRRGLM